MRTARRQIASTLGDRTLPFALISLFPGLARVFYSPAYLGPRGLAVYVVAKTLFWFALLRWVGPALRRWAAQVTGERVALRDALGREPTEDEFSRHRIEARRQRTAAQRTRPR